LEKEKEILLPACTDREIRFHYLDIHSKLSQTLHSYRHCYSISDSVMQTTSQWTCSSGTSKGLRMFLM